MFGSDILDVVIAMIFLFAVLSLIATSAREVLEGLLQTRAIHLERGIRLLLGEYTGAQTLTRQVYRHPLIDPLFSGDYPQALVPARFGGDGATRVPMRSNLPAYIPARNFALALLDLAGRPDAAKGVPAAALTVAGIRAQVDSLIPSASVRRMVALALDGAGDDLETARVNLERVFDAAMDRVSGVYRKETQWILFAIGLIFAVALNVDTVRIASTLYANQPAREAVVQQATVVAGAVREAKRADLPEVLKTFGCDRASTLARGTDCTTARLETLGVPMGWHFERVALRPDAATIRASLWALVLAMPGWLLTALAISLGAPFWFDLLNKLMVIRSTVKPHEKSPEESSEDRQSPAPPRAPRLASATGAGAPAAP